MLNKKSRCYSKSEASKRQKNREKSGAIKIGVKSDFYCYKRTGELKVHAPFLKPLEQESSNGQNCRFRIKLIIGKTAVESDGIKIVFRK